MVLVWISFAELLRSCSHFPFIIQTLNVLTRSDKVSFYSRRLVDSHSNSTASNVFFIDLVCTDRLRYEKLAIRIAHLS